jgi:diguanylate cyclase (GGDEF)-like protein/PAS domain S-box-containing protein
MQLALRQRLNVIKAGAYRPMWLGLCLISPLVLSSVAVARDVRVGVYQNEPKILLGSDGRPSGILGELLQEVAERADWSLQAVPCVWSRCLEQLAAGTIDLLPDVAVNETRAQTLDFHRVPSLNSWSQLYKHDGVTLESVLDLEGKRVLVLAGSVQQQYLQALLDSFSVQAQLIPVQSLRTGFEQVSAGKAAAVVANHHFGGFVAPEYGLQQTPVMFQPARLFYATRKGHNAELLTTLDHYLASWTSDPDSVYFSTLARWGASTPLSAVPAEFRQGLIALGSLLLLALLGTALLRWQVALKTKRLKASEQKLSTILNSVEAYIYIKDLQLRYQYGNRRVCEMFDCMPEQLIGFTDEAFLPAAVAVGLRENDQRVLDRGERVVEEEVVTGEHGQSPRTFLTVKIPLRDSRGSIYALCGISTDITEQKRSLQEIHQLAYYDQLTSLANRRLLLDRLQHALAARERNHQEGALLFFDLDNFKDLNDTLGHDMGDLLLQQVAERLNAHVRESDTLARLGGDEFVLMFEQLDQCEEIAVHQVESAACKLLEVLREPYCLPGRMYNITVSIGIAMFCDAHSTVEELLKRADLAMYEAKAAGRNQIRFFNPQMQAEVTARAAIEADLRVGLQEGQFFLQYQPQVDATGRLRGAEALVRWQHPSKGMVPPAAFIPVAEATGLILPLGRWILRTACRQLVVWSGQPEMAHLSLAVNISASQLHHADFVGDIFAILDETGANPQCLELELTESQLIRDIETVISKMNRLKARGVRFSLDDFGTGYSSLSYLKRLPLDNLKIDQSFVRDLLTDHNDAAIVKTVIALGRSLDLAVIAEGVETQAHCNALVQVGCNQFQGYHFGKPGSAKVLERWSCAYPPAASSVTRARAI